MDCIEGMKQLPDESIDLVVTSPPYDNLREYNKSSLWSFDIFKKVVAELCRVLKTGGIIVWIVSDGTTNGSETGTSFRQALYFIEVGFNLHDTMIWEKDGFSFPECNRYPQVFEYMFVFSKGVPKTFHPLKDRNTKNAGVGIHGTDRLSDGSTKKIRDNNTIIGDYGTRYNVWQQPSVKNSSKVGHPAMFPLQLAKDHILSWSNERDIVLDPFMGSGTTAIACIETDRECIGYEIDKTYYEIAQERIYQATKQQKMI